jgi:hypothetical protein
MNKFFSLCFFVSVVILAISCKKDETTPNPIPSPEPSIIGKWNYALWEKRDTMSITGGAIISTSLGRAKDLDNCTFEIKKDSTFVTAGRYNLVSTLSKPGLSPVTTTSNLGNNSSGVWEIFFGELVFTVNGGGSEFYEIESLKANELILRTYNSFTIGGNTASIFQRIVLIK